MGKPSGDNPSDDASFRARIREHYEAIRREQAAIEREVRWISSNPREPVDSRIVGGTWWFSYWDQSF
jgi:hypothetical protein